MKTLLLFVASIFIFQFSFSQWSTSTYADSALYVCPGFNQGILTFDDGSSIICGALSDSRYVQKLDPYGFNLWPQPVQVYNTPGTNNDGNALNIMSDGDGGVILWWADFRGAQSIVSDFYTFYLNNAMYMQRVDKNGQIKWQVGGEQVAPVQGGVKGGYGVTDAVNGIIFYMFEDIYDTSSGAFLKEHSWLVRYNGSGQKIWERAIDTSTIQSQLPVGQPIKLGNRIMIGTLSGLQFIGPVTGNFQTSPSYVPKGGVISFKDSIGYDIKSKNQVQDSLDIIHFYSGVTQISSSWDSVWYATFAIDDEGDGSGFGGPYNTPYEVDKKGGLFYVWSYKNKNNIPITRAQWITRTGPHWGAGGIQLAEKGAYASFNGENKLGIYFGDGTAQLYDTTGKALWDSNNVIISDGGNAYSPTIASDNNGGAIIAYWSTLGGIFAQHTGRVGKVGIITKVQANVNIPLEFSLNQNYPNPFNPTTTIRFTVNGNQLISLKIFDILGREVKRLVNEKLPQGKYEVQFNASNLSSGVYFYTLTSGTNRITKKMLLLR